MIELRDYQEEAIAGLYDWFETRTGHPLVVAPTGSGKSVILAEFIRRAVQEFPGTRVMCVTHVKELIAQNHAALRRLWPDAPAGIYSAGLNKRQNAQVLFCGVQSVAKRVRQLGAFDLVLVDEAHLIARKSSTLYGKLFAALMEMNPATKVIGLTATPYRLDSGALIGGEGALFDGIAYDIPVGMLVQRGFLAPLVSKRPNTTVDTAGLHKRGGEYTNAELDALVNQYEVTDAACDEIVALGQDRKGWIAFCVSVDHAKAVRDALRARGISAETVTGETPRQERDRILSRYKAGQIRALSSVGVLTTGFDAPHTDLIAMLRPTASTGLYVQSLGRGMRTAPGKKDCLVLDFTGNVLMHGPVDAIVMPGVKRTDIEPGEAPGKACPECSTIIHAAMRECPECGFLWLAPGIKHERTASVEAVMTLTAPKDHWRRVQDIAFARHRKAGSPDSLRVEYLVEGILVREWVCIEHAGFPRRKAAQWWARMMPGQPVPDTVGDALEALEDDPPTPKHAVIQRDGKYWRVERVRFDDPPQQQEAAA